jgi:hypothetical protein
MFSIKRNCFVVLLFFASITNGMTGTNNQNYSSGYAKIKFVDQKEVYSKTYLGKLTKGDIASLKYELQNNFADPQKSVSEKNKTEQNGYVDRVTTTKFKKSWKNNRKKAKNDLLGNYVVEDEKSLIEIKEKKLKEQEKRASKTKISEKSKKLIDTASQNKPNTSLSKHYSITGKRIYNGQTFKKRAGYVCLIIKYKIREGNFINTYVSLVEDFLKDGSNYNLKYHGEGTKRKYYLEYVPFL